MRVFGGCSAWGAEREAEVRHVGGRQRAWRWSEKQLLGDSRPASLRASWRKDVSSRYVFPPPFLHARMILDAVLSGMEILLLAYS